MKTKIAMAISIAGVLVAGTAAALVNTQVLDSKASTAPILGDSGQQTLPTDMSTSGTVSPVVTSLNTNVVAQTGSSGLSATQAVYTAAAAGTVTLDTAGDVLTIVGVTPVLGWTVTKSENEDAANVEVTFQNGPVGVEFHANLQFGIVSPSVETNDDGAIGNSVDDNGGIQGGDDDARGGDDD